MRPWVPRIVSDGILYVKVIALRVGLGIASASFAAHPIPCGLWKLGRGRSCEQSLFVHSRTICGSKNSHLPHAAVGMQNVSLRGKVTQMKICVCPLFPFLRDYFRRNLVRILCLRRVNVVPRRLSKIAPLELLLRWNAKFAFHGLETKQKPLTGADLE